MFIRYISYNKKKAFTIVLTAQAAGLQVHLKDSINTITIFKYDRCNIIIWEY